VGAAYIQSNDHPVTLRVLQLFPTIQRAYCRQSGPGRLYFVQSIPVPGTTPEKRSSYNDYKTVGSRSRIIY
jgi:hypothetical protein